MRKYFIVLLFALIANNTYSQQWLTNFEDAKSQSVKEHKPIILVFSGSDWCAPCIKLDKQIFQSETFKSYAKEHFVLVKADFPRKKQNALDPELEKQNKALAEKYNKNGFFPFVLVLTEDGQVLRESGYEKISPEAYIEKLSAFTK